jgi:hypothetical protein
MVKRTPPAVIDVDAIGARGLRGKIEKLFLEYSTKAQALRITAAILDEEDRKTAAAAAPKKFIAAMHHRNGNGNGPAERPPKKEPRPIHGRLLSLFTLEHLSETESRPGEYLVRELAANGSPVPNSRATGAAALARYGYTRFTTDGIRRTSKGTKYVAKLRQELERAGKVAPGAYLPAGTS